MRNRVFLPRITQQVKTRAAGGGHLAAAMAMLAGAAGWALVLALLGG